MHTFIAIIQHRPLEQSSQMDLCSASFPTPLLRLTCLFSNPTLVCPTVSAVTTPTATLTAHLILLPHSLYSAHPFKHSFLIYASSYFSHYCLLHLITPAHRSHSSSYHRFHYIPFSALHENCPQVPYYQMP